VGQPELAAQLHAPPGVGAGHQVHDAQRRDRLRRGAGAQQGLAHARLTRDQRLAPEQLAQGVQRALRLARERVGELASARERRVDLGARVVILEHDAHARDVRDLQDGRAGVGRHQVGEVRRALRRGQAQADIDLPAAGHGAGPDEAESGYRLVELGVIHRGQRGADSVLQVHVAPSTS
jgi:hypothetical protein